jgi:hypothetical protein
VRPFFDWFKNKPEVLSAARLEEQAKVFFLCLCLCLVVVFAFSALSCFVLSLPCLFVLCFRSCLVFFAFGLHFCLVFSVFFVLSSPCLFVLCFLSCLFCLWLAFLSCVFCFLFSVLSCVFCLWFHAPFIHGLVTGGKGQGRAQASHGSAECCSRYVPSADARCLTSLLTL